jgi:hypothetical protein
VLFIFEESRTLHFNQLALDALYQKDKRKTTILKKAFRKEQK